MPVEIDFSKKSTKLDVVWTYLWNAVQYLVPGTITYCVRVLCRPGMITGTGVQVVRVLVGTNRGSVVSTLLVPGKCVL